MMAAPPQNAIEYRCPACGRYLGTAEGVYARYAPCVCGVRTTVEIVGKRARQTVESAGTGRIEVK